MSTLRAFAVVFAVIAVVSLVAAVAGMVTGRPGPRGGFALRAVALASFGAAVALNVAAH